MPFERGYQRAATSGRKRGIPNKNTAEVKALAFMSAPKAIKKLAYLVEHGENQSVQVAACKELLDRAIGKAVPFVQSYLKNQLAAGAATSPAVAKISALAAALAGQGAQ